MTMIKKSALFLLSMILCSAIFTTVIAQENPFYNKKGKLIIIGGGAIPDSLFSFFANYCGGKDQSVVYIPTATTDEAYIQKGEHLIKFTSQGFNNLSTSIDNAVDYISSQRGGIGAQMNALGYQSQNLIATSANIEAANSTITSTDYAQAIAYITKQQIMQQASTAMLAQANQSGKIILDLCQSSAMRLMI